MKHLLSCLLLIAVSSALCSATARADVPPIAVGVRIGTLLIRDRGLDPISSSDTSLQVSLYSEIELLSPTGSDHLSVGLEWASVYYTDTLFSSFATQTDAQHVLATASYGYTVLPWLTPYVRTGAGVAFYDLSIDSGGYETDDYWLFSGYSALGAEFLIPYDVWGPGATTSAGFKLEFGYAYRAEPEFFATRSGDTPEDAVEIPVVGANLGTMPTSGYLISGDFFIRF